MDKKYKLVLHIGLPKTATSALQRNVLYPLHLEGEINFLGRVSEENQKNKHYPLADIIRILIEEECTQSEINTLRLKAEKLLSSNKLNVLSDENLSHINAFLHLDRTFYRLSQLFIHCEIKLLVSMRSPVAFIFSYYVEEYYWRFFADKARNTFENFSQDVLNHLYSQQYLTFMPKRLFSLVDAHFLDKTVLLFEDLEFDQSHYFATLAEVLNLDANALRDRFLTHIQNMKIPTHLGKLSRPVSVRHFLQRSTFAIRQSGKKSWLLRGLWLLFKYPWHFLLKLLAFITFKKAIEHTYPDAALSAQLFEALKIEDVAQFAKQHRLDKDKLIKYHYGET